MTQYKSLPLKRRNPERDKRVVIAEVTLLVVLILLLSAFAYHLQQALPYSSNVYNSPDQCVFEQDAETFDCYPEDGGDEEKCRARGCCWIPKKTPSQFPPLNAPLCFYPKNFQSYEYVNVTANNTGIVAFLALSRSSGYPDDLKLLRMDIEYQTEDRLRIKIFDPLKKRYETPFPKLTAAHHTGLFKNLSYQVEIDKEKIGFIVKKNNGDILFDSQQVGGFIFADQFLQLSGKFNGSVYGIGEHQGPLQLNMNWTRFTLLNQDAIPAENLNLYGSHPFYMVLTANGTAHGVFLMNSNAMDILLQPLPAITFRAIGGIFDFYFLMGPTPSDVIKQYVELVGKPFMPPYWSLGFHLCRLGYENVTHIQNVLNRTLQAGIPVDTQWSDIDYMTDNNDFTLNNSTFGDLPGFVKDLHELGMHFIPIIDPGISSSEPNGTYPPYDEGEKLGIFIKNQDGTTFNGKVWNKKTTVFPDFTNIQTSVYWTGLIHKFHNVLPFDGLWIDMNEPSNFLDGSINGCPDNSLETPPYSPGGNKLARKTVCMSAIHALGAHYNVHNIYGIAEAEATHRALKEINQRRPFVISRATFPGIGKYSGHWSGDVTSIWHDMKQSVSQLLSFSLYGIPMMGSDICGFNGNTTKYLCLRWHQLGAFYPFSRNHNTDDGVDQDPVALGEDVAIAAKNAFAVRYQLLPYLYTLFWRAHIFGETVARPLFFEFPEDPNTHSVDQSFLWGCCLLIVPVLDEFATTVQSYLPAGRWYNWYTLMGRESSGVNVTFNAPTDRIPIYIRGGSILPTQEPALNTALSRMKNFTLIAAYNTNLTASGSLFWDDGESLHVFETKSFGLVEFQLTPENFTSSVNHWATDHTPILDTIAILGFVRQVKQVTFNGTSWSFNWNSTSLVMSLSNLNSPMNTPFTIIWT